LVVVAALAILTEAVDRGQSAANPCDEPAAPAPSVPLPQQKKASRVALRMPLVRQLLAGQSPNGIVVDEQGTRSGTLVGVQVEVRLGHPATSVRATWPWLFTDDTDTVNPPYQIIRQHVRSQGVSSVTITVLAPAYDVGAVSNWVVEPGSSIEPAAGVTDRRPPQPHCD